MADPSVLASEPVPVGERPDAASAMAAAQTLGVSIEDVSQRTEDARVFANPDGTWSSEIASGPVRMHNPDGSWVDLDTALEQNAQGEWVPQAALVDLTFSDGGTEPFVTLGPTDGTSMSLGWPTPLPKPVVDEATLTYPDVIPNGDLVVEALPGGFSHDIVLHQAPSEPVNYKISVDLDGLQLIEEASGGLSVRTTAGKEVAAAPQPLMWDTESNPTGEPVNVAPLETSVEGVGTDMALVLSPDLQMLNDPDTEYPVTLDPTFNESPSRDTWVQNADYTSSQVGSPELRAGTYDGGEHKARSFIDFDTANLRGAPILDARLRLRNFYSGSCQNSPIRVNAMSEGWSRDAMTWSSQPDVWPGFYDEFAPAFGYTECVDSGFADWNITGMVKNWTDGTWINHGVRLKATDETDIHSWRKYRSANWDDPSMRPRLIVDYLTFASFEEAVPGVAPEGAEQTEVYLDSQNQVISNPMGKDTETTALGCTPVSLPDEPHISELTDVSGHGAWEKGTCSNNRANVFNCLYEWYTDNTWRRKDCSLTLELSPGGGRGNRTNARRTCHNRRIASWRNHVDVDVIGEIDTAENPFRKRDVDCQVF